MRTTILLGLLVDILILWLCGPWVLALVVVLGVAWMAWEVWRCKEQRF